MAKEIHICQGRKKIQGFVGMFIDYTHGKSRRNCQAKASIFEDGKWYCKRHAPSKIAEREKKAEEADARRIWRNFERNGGTTE
jgi:hypothetical protein